MPDQVTRFRVFVASPHDVSMERGLLRGVIDEINGSLGENQKFFLEYVGWEDFHPDMGPPQEVINRQTPSYDIFVGIMWNWFGTPTEHFGSGTEEEFHRAYTRWCREKNIKILFYFCMKPETFDTSEQAEQATRVIQFREDLNRRGFVQKYSKEDEFSRMVKGHLVRVVDDLLRNSPKRSRRFSVFAAAVRDQLDPLRAEILEELGLRDIEILQPHDDREVTKELLKSADLCIHLLDGTLYPEADEHLELGCQHAHRQLVWLSPRVELSPEDPDPYRRKLHALQSRDGNFDFMHCRNVTREIVERIENLKNEWLKRNSRGIFFNVHGNDKRFAKEVFDYLEERNIVPLVNKDDSGVPTLKEFEEKASHSRAIVVLYGAVSAAWVLGRLMEVVKLVYSKGYPIEKLGVYVAPPPKFGMPSICLPIGVHPVWMDNTAGFDPRTMEDLFSLF